MPLHLKYIFLYRNSPSRLPSKFTLIDGISFLFYKLNLHIIGHNNGCLLLKNERLQILHANETVHLWSYLHLSERDLVKSDPFKKYFVVLSRFRSTFLFVRNTATLVRRILMLISRNRRLRIFHLAKSQTNRRLWACIDLTPPWQKTCWLTATVLRSWFHASS